MEAKGDTVHQAIWRGNAVVVLRADDRCAVIVTPCSVTIEVRVTELREVSGERRPQKDSSIF